MENGSRRNRKFHDQDNVHIPKSVGPHKVLGELSSNTLQSQPVKNVVQRVVKSTMSCEKENESSSPASASKRNEHVQSKVDTGLLGSKSIPWPRPRPPIRREDSTDRLGAQAVISKVAPNIQNKLSEIKEKGNPQRGQSKKVVQKSCAEKVAERPPTPVLPVDIEDIDAKDNDPCLVSQYIKDIYKYLIKLEEKFPIQKGFLQIQPTINGKMRAILINWLADIQNEHIIGSDTLHLTVGIIDRYLQVQKVERSKFQLVGVAAMLIAFKYEEVESPPPLADLVYITDNAYTEAEVRRCEVDILSKLNYSFARPIPLSFLRRLVKSGHVKTDNYHLAKYFVDLCLVQYSMAHYRPSELAAAAMCLSLYLVQGELNEQKEGDSQVPVKELTEVWTPTLAYYSEYTLDHITPIMRKIAKIVVNVGNSKYKVVYNKYLDVSLGRVSSRSELMGSTIMALAANADTSAPNDIY